MSADITAIQELLSEDIRRMQYGTVVNTETLTELSELQCLGPVARGANYSQDVEQLMQEASDAEEDAAAARESFLARTELLRHVDLGELTVEDLVTAARRKPGVFQGVVMPDWRRRPGNAHTPQES
ncbi:hypothetical protein ACT3S7_11285 [Corynebacterium sp. AOP34-AQ2-28]|uniref:hypothetical protein n=1 Tax=unclassified Corynebacterium TaxID=2624378 RepID=UPI004033A005